MPTSLGEPVSCLAHHKHRPRKFVMNKDESQPQTKMRFDHPPGASPDDIAAAIRRAFERTQCSVRQGKADRCPPKTPGAISHKAAGNRTDAYASCRNQAVKVASVA